MRRKLALSMTAGAVAAAFAVPAPASAVSSDGCTLGSPNIVRDVTECVQYLLEGCNPGGSPNIIRDVLDCLPPIN